MITLVYNFGPVVTQDIMVEPTKLEKAAYLLTAGML
jgi:hypothetical protein